MCGGIGPPGAAASSELVNRRPGRSPAGCLLVAWRSTAGAEARAVARSGGTARHAAGSWRARGVLQACALSTSKQPLGRGSGHRSGQPSTNSSQRERGSGRIQVVEAPRVPTKGPNWRFDVLSAHACRRHDRGPATTAAPHPRALSATKRRFGEESGRSVAGGSNDPAGLSVARTRFRRPRQLQLPNRA
jgi:hypothetical protein